MGAQNFDFVTEFSENRVLFTPCPNFAFWTTISPQKISW